jgi:hypothetical protein
MRRCFAGLMVAGLALGIAHVAVASSMGAVARAVDVIQHDILAWKQAGVMGRVDAVASACATLAADARADLRAKRPRAFRKKLWSTYRRGMKEIATAAAHCSSPDPSLPLMQFIERDGRAIADGEGLLVDAISRAQGHLPQD